jgi:hypothetical protein
MAHEGNQSTEQPDGGIGGALGVVRRYRRALYCGCPA